VQELYIPFPSLNKTTANPLKDNIAAANQDQVVTKLTLLTVLVQ